MNNKKKLSEELYQAQTMFQIGDVISDDLDIDKLKIRHIFKNTDLEKR